MKIFLCLPHFSTSVLLLGHYSLLSRRHQYLKGGLVFFSILFFFIKLFFIKSNNVFPFKWNLLQVWWTLVENLCLVIAFLQKNGCDSEKGVKGWLNALMASTRAFFWCMVNRPCLSFLPHSVSLPFWCSNAATAFLAFLFDYLLYCQYNKNEERE